MKLGIVVLNYINYQETLICLESLLNQDYESLEIIIVDNHSDNESYQVLTKKYGSYSNIHIMTTEKNEGFARGNNVGILFAREKLQCDFVFVLNSDTEMMNTDVCKKLISNYSKGIGVINPQCLKLDYSIQKPYGKFSKSIVAETLRSFVNIFWGNFQAIFKLNIQVVDKIKNYDVNSLTENGYIIQGCSYILTPDFFKYYRCLFPKTFLYGEELILFWYLKKADLRTVLVSDALILHKEAGSTPQMNKIFQKFKRQLYSFFRSIPVLFLSAEKIAKKYSH